MLVHLPDFLQSLREQHGIVLCQIDHLTDHFTPVTATVRDLATMAGATVNDEDRDRLVRAAETGVTT